MARYFSKEVPTLSVGAVPRDIDRSMTNDELDALLKDADLIVAATDDRGVQRRVGRRALSLDIPAIFPGLYERNGGEVFVQRSSRHPCFLCRDGFRPVNETLRGVAATNPDILAIIQLASQLSLAILDRDSDDLHLLRPEQGEIPQLFVQNGLTLARRPVPWRRNCQSCVVGPPRSQSSFTSAHGAPPTRPVFTTTRQNTRSRPPTNPAEYPHDPLFSIIVAIFQFIAGVIGSLLMTWLALVGVALCWAAGFAVAGGVFWLFIKMLGHG